MNWYLRAMEVLRAHYGDIACVVGALLIGGLAADAVDVASSPYADAVDIIGMLAVLAMWWGPRFPVLIASLTFTASAVSPIAGGASIVSVYVLAAHHRGRVPAALVVLFVGAGIIRDRLFPDPALSTTRNLLVGVVLTAAAVGWGLAVRSRHDLMASLADRAIRAESDQHARVLEARRAERTRIAAEMHDVLAHRLSMLSLHAGAIEHRPGSAPEDIARSAGVIRSSAHKALDELRAVMGVLRDDAPDDLTPLPGLEDLDRLVEECRSAGMQIEVDDAIPPQAAPPAEIGRVAYRAVQEGLTNARKHAAGRPVVLRLGGQPDDGLTIMISNRVGSAAPATVPGSGLGLVGLAERAAVAGGTLQQTLSDDQHMVEVRLPWPT